MLMYIYSIFLVVWEILCCKLLMEMFHNKRKYRMKGVSCVVVAGTTVLCYLASYIFYNHLWVKQVAIIVIISIAMYLLFKSHYLKIVVLTAIYQGIVILVDYVTLLVTGEIFPDLSETLLNTVDISMLISLVCKLVLLCVILSLRKIIGNKQGDMLTNMEWFRLLLVPIITIVSLIAIVLRFHVLQEITQDNIILYIALGMAGINIIVFYLVNDIMEREAIIREDRIFREKVKNETDMYYSISENLDRQKKRTHEFKNQIACIGALINSGKYEELNTYIRKIDDELKSSTDIIDTNNVIVNAILNTKYREALEKQIVFVIKVNDLSKLSMEDKDIVVILSNLLNNAIEACALCKEKVIKLRFAVEDNQIILSVKNSISKTPMKENDYFMTSKTDNPEEHGMGVKNVIATIEKYKGKYVIEYDDNTFSFSILIPN